MQKNFISRSVGIAKLGWKARSLKQSEETRVQAAARDYLIQSMGKMKGLPQKVGQILSMSFNPDDENNFVPLVNQGEPLALAVVLDLLNTGWGQDPWEVLESIDESLRYVDFDKLIFGTPARENPWMGKSNILAMVPNLFLLVKTLHLSPKRGTISLVAIN